MVAARESSPMKMTMECKPAARGYWWRIGTLLLMLLVASAAAAADYVIAPAPAWVAPLERGLPDTASQSTMSGGVQYLLADAQVKVGEGSLVSYRRIAGMPINASGIDSITNISIDFDPSYQRLSLHAIDVIRGSETLHKLASVPVRILQRETELEARIYDGSKTASIVLDDVRAGDIVDYAFSIQGQNPVFAGKVFGGASLQYSAPVARVHERLLAPRALQLQMVTQALEMSPRISEQGDLREYVWDRHNVAPSQSDQDTPGWYDAAAKVRWSEFSNWGQVVDWALPMYLAPADPGPAVRAEISRIAAANPEPEARLRATLDFVQREVRYFGIEIGPGSHAPNPPALVLERRFGDCKDKTMLTVAMLAGMGIEARPAFVNTSSGRVLSERPPSPIAFNHVLVNARIGDRQFWLDPTRMPQSGDLDHILQPDYDTALVIGPDSHDLVPMTNASTALNKRVAKVTLDAQNGLDQPVDMRVVSTLSGAEADLMRQQLATDSRDDIQERFLNFYARYYPSIVLASAYEVEDDSERNQLVTREHYRIEQPSTYDEGRHRNEADVSAPDIDAYLKAPQDVVRTAPLAISHPVQVEVSTEVLLDDDWKVEPSVKRIVDPAFEFERVVSVYDKRVVLADSFRSLTDHVAPGEVSRYAANISRALEETNYQFQWSSVTDAAAAAGSTGFNGWLIGWLVLVLVGCFWMARALYRYDPVPPVRARARDLVGIRGWLLLPSLGVLMAPFVYLAAVFEVVPLMQAGSWWYLTSSDSASYHWLWAPAIVFSLTANLVMLAFASTLCVLFFKARSSVARLYIAYLITAFVVVLVDAVLSFGPANKTDVMAAMRPVVQQLWVVLIWCTYFMRSDRVDATFVRRRDAALAVNSVASPDTAPAPEVAPPDEMLNPPAQA